MKSTLLVIALLFSINSFGYNTEDTPNKIVCEQSKMLGLSLTRVELTETSPQEYAMRAFKRTGFLGLKPIFTANVSLFKSTSEQDLVQSLLMVGETYTITRIHLSGKKKCRISIRRNDLFSQLEEDFKFRGVVVEFSN